MLFVVISWVIFLILSLCGTALAARHMLHMFQLNSYKPKLQRKWMRKNFRQLLPLFIPLAGGFFFWPKKAKIALKYTARVKRMIFTACVLAALWIALGIWPSGISLWGCVYSYALQLLSPLLVLLANALNGPLEAAIRRYYIRDAKRLLKGHGALTVVGITGSYGKTSVKFYLNTLLRAKYNVLMTPESFNTPMGVVKTIRGSLNASHEIFICEMGAKQPGDIRELCDIARPKHGILTSIGPQHLESFGSLENVIKTKFELADALPEGGVLFANGDDANVRGGWDKYPRVVSYSAEPDGPGYRAEDIAVGERGTSFAVITPGGERERFDTRLVGRHNVVNLVGAIAAAHSLGVPLADLRARARRIEPVPHRLELIERGGMLLLDDAYNSNPSGARAALDTLRLFEGENTKILVTPGMIELGAKQEELNAVFGAQAAAACDYIVLVGEAQTRPIRQGALAAGFAEERLFTAPGLGEAMAYVNAIPGGKRKIVLLENDLPDNY
ncbi:MAG: UDP-N-acetylmuramoyl-tripeptide--D-alanyl-D-alanine ligase [Oscillospiraceae bacterium]|nr:UDP-N-acetylmuramoyl-tripeptide--D-alanyl-D-alanine ligase [Oscillospiraceae bacterium]